MRLSNRGFTLAEMCLVLFMLSVFVLLCLPASGGEISPFRTFPDAYLLCQSEALCRAQQQVFEDERGNLTYFNSRGNVRSAGTIRFGNREIVIELGGGRLVIR